ncbi:MAG: hypothetical protein AAFV38_14695, partial [Pseudomonadota bacterium]
RVMRTALRLDQPHAFQLQQHLVRAVVDLNTRESPRQSVRAFCVSLCRLEGQKGPPFVPEA